MTRAATKWDALKKYVRRGAASRPKEPIAIGNAIYDTPIMGGPVFAQPESAYVTFSDGTFKPDVCQYAEPQRIEIDGEGVDCLVPHDVVPQQVSDGATMGGRSLAQRGLFITQKRAEIQATMRARIARVMQWPYCGHTQRNVSVVWIDNVAHWQCEECNGKSRQAGDYLLITFD